MRQLTDLPSIGMVSFKKEPSGQMVLWESRSARLFLEIRSSTNLLTPNKPALSGTILIMVRMCTIKS